MWRMKLAVMLAGMAAVLHASAAEILIQTSTETGALVEGATCELQSASERREIVTPARVPVPTDSEWLRVTCKLPNGSTGFSVIAAVQRETTGSTIGRVPAFGRLLPPGELRTFPGSVTVLTRAHASGPATARSTIKPTPVVEPPKFASGGTAGDQSHMVQTQQLPVEAAAKPAPADAARSTSPGASSTAAVMDAIEAWRAAWERRDIPVYLSAYADSFRPQAGKTRSEWERERRERISKPAEIIIALSEMVIRFEANGAASATFLQRYKSDRLAETGTKKLSLTRQGERWMIVSEEFRGN